MDGKDSTKKIKLVVTEEATPGMRDIRVVEKDLGAPVRPAVKRATDLFIEQMKKEREQSKSEK